MPSNGSDLNAESIIYALAVAWSSAVCPPPTGPDCLGGHRCEVPNKAAVWVLTLFPYGPGCLGGDQGGLPGVGVLALFSAPAPTASIQHRTAGQFLLF